MTSCPSCNTVTSSNKDPCPVCAAVPPGAHCHVTTCVVCRKMMPADARRCNACGTRKRFPWPAKVAAFTSVFGNPLSVAGAIVSVWFFFGDYRSHTEFKVAEADGSAIHLKVWNTGRRPSALVGFRLKFDNIPGKEAVLAMTNDVGKSDGTAYQSNDAGKTRSVIVSATPVEIAIALPDQPALTAPEVKNLRDWESTQPMTLLMDVQESSDDAWEHHTREDHFLSGRIAAFVKVNWGG